MNFSEFLENYMKKNKITKYKIAKITGYSHSYISDLLKGRRRWNETTIDKVCQAFNITVTFTSKKTA